MTRLGFFLLLLLALPRLSIAAEPVHPAAHAAAHSGEPEVYPHPQVPEPAVWTGMMLLIVFGMFFAAAFLGPIVRQDMPEEVPPAHSHDEPPGASHHHGPSGTRVVDPHD